MAQELDLIHHRLTPLPTPEGACILAELPDDRALLTLRVLRLVLAWARGPEATGDLFAPDALDAWEIELVTHPFDQDGLWAPLAVLAGELRRPAEAAPRTIAQACLAASDWAIGAGAERTALLFAQAAALAWPSNPRYAWFAGKLALGQGRRREARAWLRRAAEGAAREGDWETRDMALDELESLRVHPRAYDRAIRDVTRALTLAGSQGARRRGTHHPDVFLVHVTADGRNDAGVLGAFELYDDTHPMLGHLALNVARLWIRQGEFGAALPVLGALAAHFPDPGPQLHVQAAIARAAGALGDAVIFAEAWDHAWALIQEAEGAVRADLPTALLDLGRGAADLGEWARATRALELALTAVPVAGAEDLTTEAEAILAGVRRGERHEVPHPISPSGATRRLARAFVRTLGAARDGGPVSHTAERRQRDSAA